jgi:hypothetical protein
MLQEPTQAASLKRSHTSKTDIEPQPQPLPTRDLPEAVWGGGLLPLLTCGDAAQLGCTCKALRGIVREHLKELGRLDLRKLQAALTTFPRAEKMALGYNLGCPFAQSEALVEWLRDRGRGGRITTMTRGDSDSYGDDVNHLVHAALRGAALPSLTSVAANVADEIQRAALAEGVLGAMEELCLFLGLHQGKDIDMGPQLAALGVVRRMPLLAKLRVRLYESRDGPAQWPPFVPPSLKNLRVDLLFEGVPSARPPRHARGQQGEARPPRNHHSPQADGDR